MPSTDHATSSVRSPPSVKGGFQALALHHCDQIAPACVHCLLAGLLVLGGAAKAGSYGAWWSVPVGVSELVLAIIAISGVTVRPNHWILVVVFLSFALASAIRIFRDDPRCGCFGELPVSPWLTLVVDTLVVTALLRWVPPRTPEPI